MSESDRNITGIPVFVSLLQILVVTGVSDQELVRRAALQNYLRVAGLEVSAHAAAGRADQPPGH